MQSECCKAYICGSLNLLYGSNKPRSFHVNEKTSELVQSTSLEMTVWQDLTVKCTLPLQAGYA